MVDNTITLRDLLLYRQRNIKPLRPTREKKQELTSIIKNYTKDADQQFCNNIIDAFSKYRTSTENRNYIKPTKQKCKETYGTLSKTLVKILQIRKSSSNPSVEFVRDSLSVFLDKDAEQFFSLLKNLDEVIHKKFIPELDEVLRPGQKFDEPIRHFIYDVGLTYIEFFGKENLDEKIIRDLCNQLILELNPNGKEITKSAFDDALSALKSGQ